MELKDIFRESRKIFKQRPEDFNSKVTDIINTLYHCQDRDDNYSYIVSESIPRVFAADISTGYKFFHNDEVVSRIWEIYNRASSIIVDSTDFKRVEKQTVPPFKIACITNVFLDFIGPTRAISNFAMNLNRRLFEPVIVSTNQILTMNRMMDSNLPGHTNTKIGVELKDAGIPIINASVCNNVADLGKELIRIISENSIDIVVSDASVFSFPEACLAMSQCTGHFFDMHQGFPLFVDNIDAILHFNSLTRKSQLSLWEERGKKVIPYYFGIPIPDFKSDYSPNDERIKFVTTSNHLKTRLSGDFCNTVIKLLQNHPETDYVLIGKCDQNTILSRIPSELHQRFIFKGPEEDEAKVLQLISEADIYLNEFPVGGGRSVLEGMSVGLPVVAMNCGDLHVETFSADYLGEYAIPEYSPEAYYTYVQELISSRDMRRRTGKALRDRFEDKYNIKNTTNELSFAILEHIKQSAN